MSDSNILILLRDKNEKGLSDLYDKYSSALFGIISRIIYDSSAAEDILSHTMLKAWNKIDSYDESKSSLFTWLSTIARNTSIDKKRLKSYQNNEKTESIDTHVYNVEASSENFAGIDVAKLTSKLDEKYKVVLDLMFLQGYSHGDISKHLEIPLGTVKTRLRSAIKILREELKQEKGLFLGTILFIVLIIASKL